MPKHESESELRIKRRADRSAVAANEMYVTRKTRLKSVMKCILAVLFMEFTPLKKQKRSSKEFLSLTHTLKMTRPQKGACVKIHALGAAVPHAIELAAGCVRQTGGQVVIANVDTSSEVLFDDIVDVETMKSQAETRINSAIHLTLKVADDVN